jgi:hypothetical protein
LQNSCQLLKEQRARRCTELAEVNKEQGDALSEVNKDLIF